MAHSKDEGGQRITWKNVFVATSHCGAGCTLGDIVGEWGIYLFGFTIAGSFLWSAYVVDFMLAYLLGIVFQYFSIVPMRHLPPGRGILAAMKADTLSLAAFQVGMYAWMALVHYALFRQPPRPDQAVFWFLMQIGMACGLLTSYPMNFWLLRKGWKERMYHGSPQSSASPQEPQINHANHRFQK